MTKADRQLVFDKYGGRCAYCGELLQKGWHVDELLPVRRKYKNVQAHWRNKITKKPREKGDMRLSDPCFDEHFEYVNAKQVPDGYEHPERMHIDNQMPACASCNINKHSMDLESFRELIKGFINSLNSYYVQYKIAKRYGLIVETIKPIVFYFETIEAEKKNKKNATV